MFNCLTFPNFLSIELTLAYSSNTSRYFDIGSSPQSFQVRLFRLLLWICTFAISITAKKFFAAQKQHFCISNFFVKETLYPPIVFLVSIAADLGNEFVWSVGKKFVCSISGTNRVPLFSFSIGGDSTFQDFYWQSSKESVGIDFISFITFNVTKLLTENVKFEHSQLSIWKN